MRFDFSFWLVPFSFPMLEPLTLALAFPHPGTQSTRPRMGGKHGCPQGTRRGELRGRLRPGQVLVTLVPPRNHYPVEELGGLPGSEAGSPLSTPRAIRCAHLVSNSERLPRHGQAGSPGNAALLPAGGQPLLPGYPHAPVLGLDAVGCLAHCPVRVRYPGEDSKSPGDFVGTDSRASLLMLT